MSDNFQVQIRPAKITDMKALLDLIKELAVYENAAEQVTNNVSQLEIDCFSDKPAFECLVAERGDEIVGFALFFPVYSTWKGSCLYLEDICVREQLRRKGIGKKLFDAVLEIAQIRNMKRLSWQVLDWNESAISFYKKYKTEFDSSWINCRIVL
ncbi:MAG: GNAT family N-acetyltransferase [Crocinitomicaceae bacterium]|nr:GNAT family N-acetyltransferase [Crocinitomicaceae bacterium]